MTTIPQGRLLRRGLRVIGAQVALHPRPFLLAVAGAMVYALATVGQSWVLGQVVDRVVTPRFETGDFRLGAALAAAAAIVAVGLVKTAGVICRRTAATVAYANVQATLRERLTEQFHRLPLTWHHRNPAGELLSRTEGDLDALSHIMSPLPFATGVITMLVVAAVWLVVCYIGVNLGVVALFRIGAVQRCDALRVRRRIFEVLRLGTPIVSGNQSTVFWKNNGEEEG